MAHPTRATLAGTTAVLALLLSGCTSSETTEGAAPAPGTESTGAADEAPADDGDDAASLPDVCALLTPAEIESATGMAVSDGVADPERQTSSSSLCQWDQADGAGFVGVAIAPGAPMPYEEGEDEALGTITAVTVPGSGEAYIVRKGITMGMMVGDDYVAVTFSGDYDGEHSDGTIAVATAVAANMG